MWWLNNILLKSDGAKEEIKGEVTRYIKTRAWQWEWQNDVSKLLGCSKSSNKREVYIITGLSKETRGIPSKQPNITSLKTRKRRINTTECQ